MQHASSLPQNYGFIAPDTGGPDIFVHKRNVRRDAEGRRPLEKWWRVMVSWKHDLWKGWGLSQNHVPPVSLHKFLEGFVNVLPRHMDVLFQAIDLDPAERVMVKLEFGKIWIHRSHHFRGEFSAGNITSKMSIPRWRDKQFPTSQWHSGKLCEIQKFIHIKSWLSIWGVNHSDLVRRVALKEGERVEFDVQEVTSGCSR